jgi:hypothetical protein
VSVRVDSGSTIHLRGNTYSVSSRLIGERVEARLYAERVEVWYAGRLLESLPRLRGRGKHRIEYRHVIDWLVRKPGAFADYRYRQDLFPSSTFRLAYDVLVERQPERAAKEYLQVLYLAARHSESAVAAALLRLQQQEQTPLAALVTEELNRTDKLMSPLQINVAAVNLASYDALLTGKEAPDDHDNDERRTPRDAGGLPEGAASAGLPSGLRGVGASGAAGSGQLRAVPVGTGSAGVPGATRPQDGTTAPRLALTAGEELAGSGPEASAGQSSPAGASAVGGVVRGPARECVGLRRAGFGEDALTVCLRPGVGALGSQGAVLVEGLLVQELPLAKRDLKLSRVLKRLAGYEVLILDDLGYVQQSREEMEVLFTLLAERYERGSVLLTSNLPFSGWEAIFKDPMTTAAAIDRLVHHSVIVELNISSYRAEQAKKAKQARPTTPEDVQT